MGQTCVAPDYVIIPQSIESIFVKEVKKILLEFYGEQPKRSGDLSRIINKRQFSRLKLLLDSVNPSDIIVGVSCDENNLWIEPTIVKVPLHATNNINSVSTSSSFSLFHLAINGLYSPRENLPRIQQQSNPIYRQY